MTQAVKSVVKRLGFSYNLKGFVCFTTLRICMMRIILILLFVFVASLPLSPAQDEPLFDDSDLVDIEGAKDEPDEDQQLEEDFNSLEGEPADDNFDEEDFEVIDEDEEENMEEDSLDDVEKDIKEEEESFDKEDYEIISDRPDYEAISDEELEMEFEGQGSKQESEGDLSDPADEEGLEGDLSDPADEEGLEGDLSDPADEEGLEGDLSDPADEEGLEGDLSDPADEEGLEGDLSDPADEEGLEGDLSDPADEEGLEDAKSEEEGKTSVLNTITNIRYVREKDQIFIDCTEVTSYQARENDKTNQLVIEILQTQLSDQLTWPFVFRDFKTNFGLMLADEKDSNIVRLVLQIKEGADFPKHTQNKAGDKIIIGYGEVVDYQIIPEEDSFNRSSKDSKSILPAKTLEDLYLGTTEFSGFPISFHVTSAPIKQVLRFISEESGLNMVIGENVSGNITLKLEDVPWDQALHIIFKVMSLGYTREGNVITILPLADIEKRINKLKEISDRQRSLSPYETKVIPINYGKTTEIQSKVKDFSTPKLTGSQSGGGKIIIDDKNNTLIVIDTPEAIKKIEAMVQYLDTAPKQVMVEAKIVEVTEFFTRDFGLTWSLTQNFPTTFDYAGIVRFSSPTDIVNNLFGDIGGNMGFSSTGSASLNLSGLPIIGDLGASLNLAESDGHAQVISSPKVVVISGKSASITRNAPILVSKGVISTAAPANQQGAGSALQPLAQSAPATQDVKIDLTVKPEVTSTGSIFLQVNVTRTDPGPSAGSEGEALVVNRTANTEILAKNGQTIVIGGIYEQDKSESKSAWPFLGDIPILNLLFSTSTRRNSKTELLIFITPKVLDSHV